MRASVSNARGRADAAFSRALILANHSSRESTMNQTDFPVQSSTHAVDRTRRAAIAVICASWHGDIVDKAKQSLLAEFDGDAAELLALAWTRSDLRPEDEQ